MNGVDAREVMTRVLKYFIEGLVVAVAAYALPGKTLKVVDVVSIGLVAAATFSLLDLFAPSISGSARQGAGFGVGAGLVGWPAGGLA
jgi:hypothetical protein